MGGRDDRLSRRARRSEWEKPRLLLDAARPRQWAKNVLVLAAPAAAGVLGRDDVLGRVLVVVMAFCMLASGGYLVNDAVDAERDRRHPRKRLRPVAAGAISRPTALIVGAVLFVAGLGLCLAVGVQVLIVGAAYVALTSPTRCGSSASRSSR